MNADILSEELKAKVLARSLPVASGCREWQGALQRGYGRIRWRQQWWRAHRKSYEAHVGAIPSGLGVLHACDNPRCVNPDHLFVGTNADNVRDKVKKGRALKGDSHGSSKLTEKQVVELRASPLSSYAIAKALGVSPKAIRHARAGSTWAHVPFPDAIGAREKVAS